MTRLNLVPVQELHDQHLFAEFREIRDVPRALARSLAARGLSGVLAMIPREYVLGPGHVAFFYDKGTYLHMRYEDLRLELVLRGVRINREAALDPQHIYHTASVLRGNYTPTPAALSLARARIAERVALRPNWYRHTGVKAA